jgi:nitrite reductase (NADH) large subunit
VIICSCNAVSDHTIREAIRAGAASCKAVARRCGAGTFCGGCVPAIDALLKAERAQLEPAQEPVSLSLEMLSPA